MRLRIATVAAACLFSTSVGAADLYFEPPAAIPFVPAAYDWTGFYVGVNAGYGGGVFRHPFDLEIDFQEFDELSGSLDVTAGGFVGGLQAGYNHQMDNVVVGVEADIQGSTIDGRVSATITSGGDTVDFEAGTRLDWFGTVRGRLGYAHDRFMVYATGGLAYGQTTSSVSVSLGGPTLDASESRTRVGWTVGAGLEYALMDNLSFKTEYLYTDLGTENLINEVFTDPDGSLSLDSSVAFHTVRAGLNYHF